jgi:hypothetical protein
MGVQEQNAWAMLVTAVVGVGVYLTLLLLNLDGGSLTTVDYQPLMLWTIAASIAVTIGAHIAISIRANIAGEREKPDERDRAIERLGVQVGQAFLIIGGLAALLMALAEWEWFWIANVLYFGFALSGILEGISKVTAYRRGVPW